MRLEVVFFMRLFDINEIQDTFFGQKKFYFDFDLRTSSKYQHILEYQLYMKKYPRSIIHLDKRLYPLVSENKIDLFELSIQEALIDLKISSHKLVKISPDNWYWRFRKQNIADFYDNYIYNADFLNGLDKNVRRSIKSIKHHYTQSAKGFPDFIDQSHSHLQAFEVKSPNDQFKIEQYEKSFLLSGCGFLYNLVQVSEYKNNISFKNDLKNKKEVGRFKFDCYLESKVGSSLYSDIGLSIWDEKVPNFLISSELLINYIKLIFDFGICDWERYFFQLLNCISDKKFNTDVLILLKQAIFWHNIKADDINCYDYEKLVVALEEIIESNCKGNRSHFKHYLKLKPHRIQGYYLRDRTKKLNLKNVKI